MVRRFRALLATRRECCRVGVDLVVAPNKSDSTLSFGRVAGNYDNIPTAPQHRHRRKVTWLRTTVTLAADIPVADSSRAWWACQWAQVA